MVPTSPGTTDQRDPLEQARQLTALHCLLDSTHALIIIDD